MSSSRIRYLFTLAVPLGALVLGSAWMFGLPGSQPTLIYDTSEVTRGQIRKVVSTSGPVRALVTVSVGSQLSGQIQALKVDFNSEVKEGDELATLDAKTFAAKVAQAKADLAAAQAQILNQQAALQKGEAVLRQAERATVRQQTLARTGVTSAAALDTATRDADVARAEIAVAKAQIENAKAVVAQRQAQLEQAQIDLDRTTIRSPIDGTVISRTIDVGQTVAASLQAPELFKIAQDLRRIRIEAQVNEADVGSIAEGNAVEFTVDAYPERRFAGKVTQVRLAAVELNNVVTYTVIIEASNDDRKLFPGMTANAQVESARKDGALRISLDSLRFKPREGTPGAAATPANQGAQRVQQMLERMKQDVALTDDQVARISEEARRVFAEAQRQAGGQSGTASPFGGPGAGGSAGAGGGQDQQRGRALQQVVQFAESILKPEQKPAFEAWKAARAAERASGAASRGQSRTATVWVLGKAGTPEPRVVRLGLQDDQYVEVLGRNVQEGEKIVVRAREAKK